MGERIFDKLKGFPIFARAAHVLEPAIRDFRNAVYKKFDGIEAKVTAAAQRVDTGIKIAFGYNRADMRAAYPILEAGGARIGDEGPTDSDFRKRETAVRELGAMKQQRDQLQSEADFLENSITHLKRQVAQEDINDPDAHEQNVANLKDRQDDLKKTYDQINSVDAQMKTHADAIKEFNDSIPPTRDDVVGRISNELNNARRALEAPNIPEATKDVIRKFIPDYEHALKNFDELAPKTKRVKQAFDEAYELRKQFDPDGKYMRDYVSRVYELNKTRGDSPLPPESLIGGGKSGITSFNEARKYDTIMDAMIGRQTPNGGWESETPRSLDVSELAANHTKVSHDMAENAMLKDEFETTPYPTDGQPVFAQKPTPDSPLPPNYVEVQAPFGQKAYVYKPIADVFKTIWGESAIRNTDVGRVALAATALVKHATLALDTFHLSRVNQKAVMEAIAQGRFDKVGDYFKNLPSYSEQGDMGKYLATLNLDPRDVDAAIKIGALTPEAGEFVKGAGQELLKRSQSGGLLAGRFTDNLWKEAEPFIRRAASKVGAESAVDKLAEFNKFTFDRVTKAAMISAFEDRLATIDKNFPELTEVQRNRKAAQEINEQFGNIGRGGFLKSRTAQDFGQLFMLAPNWVQSQVMAEARQYGQIARAGFDAAVGRKNPDGSRERVLRFGNSARFLASTALTIFAANQAINLATRGQFTWQNPEKDHQFDAFIPSATGPKGTGFFYSPLALPSEYVHHLRNYSQFESVPSAISHIASNKLSPLASAAKVALTQKNYQGQKLTPGQTALTTLQQAIPVPIMASSAAKGFSGTSKAGTTQQNLMRSAGISTDRAPDAVQNAYQQFQDYRKPGQTESGPSPYRNLKTIIQNGGSPQDINAEVANLVKGGKKIDDIRKSFNSQFHASGSVAGDLQALKEHPELKPVLEAAKAQKQAERQTFYKAQQTK